MKYMADTIVKYVLGETNRHSGMLRFVLPSYPSDLLLKIGLELDDLFRRITDRRVDWEYKIAYRLGKEWENGTSSDQANFERICEEGWYNEDDNLTSLRNTVKDPDCDRLVILLAGYEHIDDRASLRDFFHLNQETVWELCLKKSFTNWVTACLKNYVNPDGSEEDIKQIAEVFKDLYHNALTDMLGVSSYLERLDISDVMTCSDAYHLILSNLSPFKLPCMNGLVGRYRSRKSFSSYIKPAQNFYNYSRFFSPSDRKKTIEKINKFRDEHGDEQLESDTLGSFYSLELLLDALEDYIENRSEAARKQLLSADFIYIHDKILNFKAKKPENGERDKRRGRGVKKLCGLPPEVFLRALWITLGDFKKESQGSLLVAENLSSITLQSTVFRHDFDDEDEGDLEDDNEKAKTFLRKVLGGIDDFFGVQLRDLGDLSKPKVFNVKVNSHLCPGEDSGVSYQRNKRAEPQLKFRVIVTSKEGDSCKREFAWALPQNHQCRLLDALYQWVLESFEECSNAIPVFTMPYIPEIFMADDEENVNRLIGTALGTGCSFINLMNAEGFDNRDAVKPLLNDLSISFQHFLKEYDQAGFFKALDSKYAPLRRTYSTAYEKYLQCNESSAGPLLFKAFMFVASDNAEQVWWVWNEYQECMVVTPLHPALLEMIHNSHTFLCESFCFYARTGLQEVGGKFPEKHWDQIVDLSRMKRPILGTLKNEDLVLDTNMRSYGYFHLVGECAKDPTSINARLLLEYEDNDEDEVTDTDLFRETRASILIKQILNDYYRLHKYVDDGISIAAYCGDQIQPFVSGIDNYLSSILKDRDERVYTLQLTIFSDSGDDSSVMKWVNAWKERWQESEASSRQYYSKCKISIAYRVVSRGENYDQFRELLQGIEVDVVFFMDFIRSGFSRFRELAYDAQGSYRKFPILEKICCPETGGGRDNKRVRILSNQRFKMGTLHAEVMARIKQGHADPGKRHVVMGVSDFQQWTSVIDTAHQHSAWVACIDPSVDEQLLRKVEPDGTSKREVIGFGTGVGSHGENNYTISTEQFSLADISKKIGAQISRLFEFLQGDVTSRIAESLIREASNIGGLSVVKATGPSEYVRDYIAYAMVRKLLPTDDSAFCDEIISLDAFRHWFDDATDQKRPDILRLQAKIVDGYFDIKAQIIECKLAQQSEGHLEKARQQIENGLEQLTACFKPRYDTETPEGIKDRPDRRYWWMQLHRLIASKGTTSRAEYNETLQALERLSEGYFNITWQAAAVAFWTDVEGDCMRCQSEWSFNIDDQEMAVSVATAGNNFINKVCLEDKRGEIFCCSSELKCSFVKKDETTEDETETAGEYEAETKKAELLDEDSIPEVDNQDNEDINAEPSGDSNENITVVSHVPERILLGSGTMGGRDVYWEFGHPDLPNRHILVFGASGTGKTYTIQALLCELGKSGQNSLIVDYTNGFTSSQLESIVVEKLNPKQHVVRMEPLPINPFRRQCDFIDDFKLEEDSATIARRVRDLFSQVYRLGDQQQSALYNAIRNGVEQDESSFNLERLLERLEVIQHEGGPSAASAASVISKLQPFVDMKPFGKEDEDSWEKMFTDTGSRCHIIQLAGFMKDTAQLITEFSLFDLYWYYRARGNKDNPKVIVLDEIQNLDHSLNSPLGQLLTEGRKFGISLILATQTLSNLAKEERDRLFQASHKLFFKPADTEIRTFAQILADVTNGRLEDWVDRLSSLKRGECFSLGNAFNEATGKLEVSKWFKIRINPLEQRY
jgi:DNA phosphorothioation-dependent restriction protein DptH